MGGKTQQRVAGDARPSSSGRARELLINKHETGSIITFSTLVNANKPVILSKKSENDPNLANCKIRPDRRRCIPMPSEVSTPISKTDKEGKEASVPVADSKKNGQPLELGLEIKQKVPEVKVEEQKLDFDTVLEQLENVMVSCDNVKSESLADLDDDSLKQELELLRLLKILIKDFSRELSIEEWDIIVRSVYKWVGLIYNSSRVSDLTGKTHFCVQAFCLIHQLILFAKEWRESSNEEEKAENPMIQSLLNDWGNFHSSVLYEDLLILFLRLFALDDLNEDDLSLVEALASIIIEVDSKSVASHKNLANYVQARADIDQEFKYPPNSIFCTLDHTKFDGIFAICGLLKSNHRVVSITAHAILSKNMKEISENVGAELLDLEVDPEDTLFVPPQILMSTLTSRDYIMSALLSDFQVGDVTVSIEPDSDSYTCALAYLLVWDLVIQFIVNVDKQLGHRLIHGLKALGLIQNLLDNIFMFLPPPSEKDSLILRFSTESEERNIGPSSFIQDWSLSKFLKTPLQTPLKRSMNELELIALHLYFSVASHMPVTVRKWYNNNSNKRLCNIVNEYTVKHISKIICSREMESVQEHCKERASDDNMTNLVIKSRPTANEVYAVYTRDEFRMELTIKFPVNYPLGSVQIDGGKRVGVTDLKWRSWLLQLTTFLAHQNGPLLDGIDLWRKNIDKRFEGVEKCMICFSILHSNYQLPKKKCITCSKMFHNLCLYKWFKTSGNSKCPLCRNIW